MYSKGDFLNADSYRGHGGLALEAAADGIVNTLGLAPRRRHTLEPVRLVTVEAVGACDSSCQSFISLRRFVSSNCSCWSVDFIALRPP